MNGGGGEERAGPPGDVKGHGESYGLVSSNRWPFSFHSAETHCGGFAKGHKLE